MIRLNEVNFGYRYQQTVLKQISLDIKPGQIYGLLGKNGEGKTTLLHIMSGLLFPRNGKCIVLDEQPDKRKAQFLSRVYLLAEDIYIPDVTFRQYIDMYRPFYPSFSDNLLKHCTDAFEIETSKKMKKMSQGQKKKAAITLALAANTPLLLMDEPTNGLDIPSKSIFRKLLSSIMTDDRTVIISTHQVRDLESLIDAVIILDGKEIVFNLPLDRIGEKLEFRLLDAGEKSLYSEPSPGGMIGVVPNGGNEAGVVSLELLFNATVLSKNEIRKIFNS
ncbi:MAG: ABC transporter ATP-binding protein [Tannerellaceae bacterium]|jgi:ABC-2 type transport system ATP-binding protein|nr:ABC transporter ATP-binding protein [Tannerellaceae bacterium]